MGADGGSIPRRDEMVRTKKAPEKPDSTSQLIATWFKCALSRQPLTLPVVSCGLGKLYNKEPILEVLLGRGGYGDADVICGHVKSLKDIVTLNLTINPAFQSKNASSLVSSVDKISTTAQFMCPITHKEMNGTIRFCYIASCGCVFTEQALKEISHNGKCLSCEKEFDVEKDVVLINPSTDEEKKKAVERMERLNEEEAERKRLKKAQKKAKSASKDDQPGLTASSGSDEDIKSSKKKRRSSPDDEDDGDRLSKKPTAKKNSNINLSLPDLSSLDPVANASDAVKSLYSKKGQKQEKMNFMISGTFNRYGGTF